MPGIDLIIDVHTTVNRLYVLKEPHVVEIYNLDLTREKTIELRKKTERCLKIYADAHTLMIGFEDGTMELYQITEDDRYLRVTSSADAGGPGSTRIDQIAASPDFVLVQSYENGLLIYSKPSLLFYKWIMLGGHCEILNFTILDNLLYVLVDRPEHEIHMLDFDKHRIFEQEVMAYTYIDIEFDGIYLYGATSSSVILYLQEEAERPMKQYQVGQLNFDETVVGLFSYQECIYVVFDGFIREIKLNVNDLETPEISPSNKIGFPSSQLYPILKYDYFSAQPHEVFADTRIFHYLDQNRQIQQVTINA